MALPGGDDPADRPGNVREGETLDAPALLRFLSDAGLPHGKTLDVAQFPRGYSNLTYLLSTGGHEYVLRRPPAGVGKGTAHDVIREARILAALAPVYPQVPPVRAVCDDASVVGAPFFLMGRVHGIVLRDHLPPHVPAGPDTMSVLTHRVVETLAGIHAIDVHAAGLSSFGNPDGYVDRQVHGWSERYRRAATGEQREIEGVAAWLAAHRPPSAGGTVVHTVVHNDFKLDNLVLDRHDPTRVLAVLDWEMATVGDPWLDLGTTLAYWVEPDDAPALRALGLGVTALPGCLTREGVVAHYAESTGREVTDVPFYYAFGLFKVAVIVQQIYARYVRGHTRDARFARLDEAVRVLGHAAAEVIASGRIGR